MLSYQGKVETLILGFTGTGGLIALAVGISGTLFSRMLARLGAASIGVFLMHPYFQGLTRILLKQGFGLDNGFSVAIQIGGGGDCAGISL